MNLSRREFSSVMGAALASGFPLQREASAAEATALYDVPKTGNVHLLHMTDSHAQLLPSYFREPSVNLGLGASSRGQQKCRAADLGGDGNLSQSKKNHQACHAQYANSRGRSRQFGVGLNCSSWFAFQVAPTSFSYCRRSRLRGLIPLDGLGCLFIFGCHKPDRPLGWLGRRGQLTQRVEDLSQLIARIAAERVVLHV